MAINKNFVVKNGLEVHDKLIYADPVKNQVGINTDVTEYELDVKGQIGVSTVLIRDQLILDGTLKVGSSVGQTGQYLISTGNGVIWQSLPNTRQVETRTAGIGQTNFPVTYIEGLIDVFVNGVKLSGDEFIADDKVSVKLKDPCFGGETVEFIIYSAYNVGVSSGISGIAILDENGVITPSASSINFVGAGITASKSGFAVTVSLLGALWQVNEFGETYTFSNVGVGTEFPSRTLDVDGSIRFNGDLYNGDKLFSPSTFVRSEFIGYATALSTNNVGVGSTVIFVIPPNETVGNDCYLLNDGEYIQITNVGLTSVSLFSPINSSISTNDVLTFAKQSVYRNSNVGIGSTIPNYNLDVQGVINTSNDIKINGVSVLESASNDAISLAIALG